jgi:hypothetical protein
MEKILNRLNGAAIYTKLDLKNTYYKICIRKGDEWKTIFKTKYGHFKYKIILFSLINVPVIFQTYIGKSVKVLDKVGARISALKALKALKKLGAAQIIYFKNRSSFKQLRTHIS